ncbi:hypothetical protein QR685DRAFT_336203 [Neurospora intermedia]|uniref:Uncharacterized protein n=1 Tax=Neurospora intermedia TaxID=5142 RepID=A0ABR3D6K2_NEUIN
MGYHDDKRCSSACQVCVYATADSSITLFLPTLQTVQRHPRNCTTTHSLLEFAPFHGFFDTVQLHPVRIHGLQRFGMGAESWVVWGLCVFVGFMAEAALYSTRRCKISFSSVETLPIPYTQHSSSFLGFPANFTSRSRHTRADHFSFCLSHFHQLMITRLNTIGSTGGSGSMDHKKVRTQNSIHDGWTGFLSWLAVSQIFRVNGGGVVFCSFWYGGLT